MMTVLIAWQCNCPRPLDLPSLADTGHAATLDTGLVAKSYPGGSLAHLSSTRFQYARPSDCSPLRCVRYPCMHRSVARKSTKHSPMFLVDYVTFRKSITDPRESIMPYKLRRYVKHFQGRRVFHKTHDTVRNLRTPQEQVLQSLFACV